MLTFCLLKYLILNSKTLNNNKNKDQMNLISNLLMAIPYHWNSLLMANKTHKIGGKWRRAKEASIGVIH